MLGLAVALVAGLLALPAAAQAATGSIAGSVTAESGGAPIPGVEVCASGILPTFGNACDTTDVAGEYEIGELADGRYSVHFRPADDYVERSYSDPGSGDIGVTVAGGAATVGIDVALTTAAHVEGTVTAAAGGAALEGVYVCTVPPGNSPGQGKCTYSGASGAYAIGGIPPGEWEVRFSGSAPQTGDYLTQWWDGAGSAESGTVIPLAGGQVKTGIDAAMVKGGAIAGTVTDGEGNPVESDSVCTYPVLGNGTGSHCDITRPDGTYRIGGLAPAEYKVSFSRSQHGNLQRQFWNDSPTRREAGAVTVAGPETVEGIDAHLHPGARITGLVTDTDANPLNGATVCARRLVTEGAQYCSTSNSAGEYAIEAMPSGEYGVYFEKSFPVPYVKRWYGGGAEPGQPMTISAGSTLSGISDALTRGATISGEVTDQASGEPLAGIEACITDAQIFFGGCAVSDDAGEYEIEGVPPGQHLVSFRPAVSNPFNSFKSGDPHYATQFWDGVTAEADATPVNATASSPATDVDAAMVEGGAIAGTVKGPDGERVANAEVCTYLTANSVDRCDAANEEGEYEIVGLLPGPHAVHVEPFADGMVGEFYSGSASYADATPVSVTGSATTPAIDFQLGRDGSISGTVTDAYDGAPIQGASVCVVAIADGSLLRCGETSALGTYLFSRLAPGTYGVRFADGYYEDDGRVDEFTTQFFAGAATIDGASPVTVSAGAITAEIDASLSPTQAILDSLSVDRDGEGEGGVTSSPAGIDCGVNCSDEFETRKTVTLQAEPDPGSTFTGWTGACSGTGPCQVRLTGDATVGASFEPTGSGGGGDETGGGSGGPAGGGGTGATPATTPPTAPPGPGPQPAKKRCPKAKKLKKVGGKQRCVKKHHHRARHHR